MARNQPPVDREQYLEQVTGETELARHDEQLDRQEEDQPRRAMPAAPGGRPSAVTIVPPRRRAAPLAAAAGEGAANPAQAPHASPQQVAEFGLSDHHLPGGVLHPTLEPLERERLHPKVPGPFYDGIMSHGVPIDTGNPPNHGRIAPAWPARHGHEASDIPRHEVIETEPDPVPVYVVERAGGGKGRLDTATVNRTAPVSGSDPVRLTAQDLRRQRVGLLNEDAAHDARVSKSLADLAQGKGILLPHGATSYLWLNTQDDLFAVGTSANTVAISVITEYELPNGA
jgi:hypothetical protein